MKQQLNLVCCSVCVCVCWGGGGCNVYEFMTIKSHFGEHLWLTGTVPVQHHEVMAFFDKIQRT